MAPLSALHLGFHIPAARISRQYTTRTHISARRRQPVHRYYRKLRATLSENDASSKKFVEESIAQDALERFAVECQTAHSLLERAEVILPTGAGAKAAAEGVDMKSVAEAYGHVLARDIRGLRAQIDTAAVSQGLIEACVSDAPSAPVPLQQFEMWLRAAQAENNNPTESSDGNVHISSAEMSKTYGYMLGCALSSSALDLDPEIVASGIVNAADGKFPMAESDYDEQFETLQGHAAAAQASAWERSADKYFAWLRSQKGVADLENDGFVLGVPGKTIGTGIPAGAGDSELPEAEIVMHGRFLDGRSFVVPTYSDGLDRPADTVLVPLADVPSALRSGVCGMRVGECRTLFLHTYAAVEVLDVFGGRDRFPPNVALVVDIYLHSILDKN